jgi:hypothetical protein
MKTSLDLPDELYRQLKAKSALQGRTVREVATSLFTAWVEDRVPASSLSADEALESLSPTANTPTEAHEPATATPQALNAAQLAWLEQWRSMSAQVAQAMHGESGLVESLERDRR